MYNKLKPVVSKTELITPKTKIDPSKYADKLLAFHVIALEFNLIQHPYDMDVELK